MNKKIKMTLSVGVLAVLCGTYIGVKTYVAKEEETETSESTETEVLSVSVDEIKTVKFLIDKKETEFEKTESEWKLSGEENFPVNSDTLTSAVQKLSSLTTDRVLEDVEDLKEYGLDVPTNTITVTDTEGETNTLKIGTLNEAVNQYYVSKDTDSETVYMIDSYNITPFMNTLYDYAKSDDFPAINSSDVKQIQVKTDTTEYCVNYQEEDGLWNVTQDGVTEKAASAKALNLATALGSMEYADFINYEAEELSDYGLENPYASIVVDYQEEIVVEENTEEVEEETAEEVTEEEPVMEEKTLTIHIGAEADDASRYVAIDDSKEIYTLSTETLQTFLGKTIDDFLDLTVSYMPLNNLSELEITYQGETKTFNVSRETYENEDGEEEEKTVYKMNDEVIEDVTNFSIFYNKLSNMTAQKILKEEYKSNTPEIKAVFKSNDSESMEVEYFNYDTNFYVALQGDKVYLVNKMNVKEMLDAYEAV